MTQDNPPRRSLVRAAAGRLRALPLALIALGAAACASSTAAPGTAPEAGSPEAAETGAPAGADGTAGTARGGDGARPSPDPRVGLGAGLFDAEEASWNLRLLSTTPPPEDFVGVTNSDLAFKGPYAIQGNYNGILVWDISDPRRPELVEEYLCPASQSDVSVYGDLLFVSGEGLGGRLDCGTQGVEQAVSEARLRGIRIFDISDIRNPEYVHNVQTCRGSHTHTVLKHPGDDENVYIYVSGSAPVRPAEELPGCSSASPEEDPGTALFRIEVIRVPLESPQEAAIVSSPRIFEGLEAPPEHGPSEADLAEIEEARARGAFIVDVQGQEYVLPDQATEGMLADIVEERGGQGPATAADSAELRRRLPAMIAQMVGDDEGEDTGPTQCHDITVYPALGVAGGACEGYGLLLDISDPVNPRRIDAVADSNFAYWHSATFSNDGSQILFTDEWGGGGQPKCRADDPRQWGANALFTIEGGEMEFASYYKLPAPQTPEENCVAHNGSLIPVPGRDVMVQGWYQGGISVLDWTDPANPVEIAFFDRGPVSPESMEMGGSWSAYWYNGVIVNSEIARGLDVLELQPSAHLSENEIEAANSVRLDHFNAQGQQRFEWPPTFALARAYLDQLERSGGLSADRIASTREVLREAEAASGAARREALSALAAELEGEASGSADAEKVRTLAGAVRDLASER